MMGGLLDALRGGKGSEEVQTDGGGPDSPGSGGDSGSPDLSSARAAARKAGRGPSKVAKQAAEAQQEAAIAELFEAENWKAVGSLYFDARFAMTGYEGFRLSEKQSDVLATTLSASMRTLLKIDPAYVALTVFLTNFGGLIAQKEVTYRHALAAARRAEKK
jgi:hypothetical protein